MWILAAKTGADYLISNDSSCLMQSGGFVEAFRLKNESAASGGGPG